MPVIIDEEHHPALKPQKNSRLQASRLERKNPLLWKILDTAKWPLIIWILVTLILQFWLLSGFIPSNSMEPSLMTGDMILADRLAYKFGTTPHRGDVVVFRHETSSKEATLLVKRVIGVAGDTVDLKNGSVYVNGCLLDESAYAHGQTVALVEGRNHFEVPKDSVLVFGDNRENSADARYWPDPYLSTDKVIGRVSVVYGLFGENGARWPSFVQSADPKFQLPQDTEKQKTAANETEKAENNAAVSNPDKPTEESKRN